MGSDEQVVRRAGPNVVQSTDLTRSCFRHLFPAGEKGERSV